MRIFTFPLALPDKAVYCVGVSKSNNQNKGEIVKTKYIEVSGVEHAALLAVAEAAEVSVHNLNRMMALLEGRGMSMKGGKFLAEIKDLEAALAALAEIRKGAN